MMIAESEVPPANGEPSPPPSSPRWPLGKRIKTIGALDKYLAASARAARSADGRSVALQDQLQAKWRDHVRRLSAGQREAWLKTQEAFVAFGVAACQDILAAIARRREDVLDSVPSLPWLDAWEATGELGPSYNVTHQARWRRRDGDSVRRYSAKMVLSEAFIAVGDREPRRRFTPPQAVAEEDRFDLMSDEEAVFCTLPSSCSATFIHRWRGKNAPSDYARW